MSDRQPGKQGLFELVIVLLLIALIAGQLVRYVLKAIDDSWAVSMVAQAQVFTSVVSMVSWSWKLQGANYFPATEIDSSGIFVDGSRLYVNRYGWPTHTNAGLSQRPLAAAGCLQVWNALLQNPGNASVAGEELEPNNAIQVQVVDSHFCRYNLRTRSNTLHYFDYDVTNGQIKVVNGLN